MSESIRLATHDDLAAINDIYNHYVRTSTCTFQTEDEPLAGRIAWFNNRDARLPVTVMEAGGKVVAWGSLSKFKPRAAYDRTVENSIYVAHDALGRGYGRTMLEDQLRRAGEIGHRVILAVIAADQAPSVALHKQYGFTLMGQMNNVGYKFDRWLDVQIWQKQLW